MPTGRFAPSPTAPLHVGNLRTALLAWLFARSAGGSFLLRVEDLNRTACRPEHEASQLDDLAAIGLDWDGPVVRQSERSERYDAAIGDLVARGLTYACYCTRREILDAADAPHEHLPDGAYPGTCRDLTAAERAQHEADGRPPALRLRADGAAMSFDDAVHGPQVGVVDDFVVRRNDRTPAYNLAVVVDDAAQDVEQVVRGADLLAGTARHVHLAGALGVSVPAYAHVPLVLGPDGERLSKRHGGSTLADRGRSGESPADVVRLLAGGLGLCEPGEPVAARDLIVRFDPAHLSPEPWRLPA
jgi:glutamyl-tRNA synthetase